VATPAVREALVRIVRESITNAARHGEAEHVTVTFSLDGVLQITDDGKGFTPETATPNRFGLVSMRERAERLGARFRIESQPGRGTRVEVALP
jgi:signal transduction histidine kinase